MSLKKGEITIPTKFLESQAKYEEGEIIIVGVPMDSTCSFRPGTRFGPQKIREVSYGLEEYSFYQDRTIEDVRFFDAGDLDLPTGNVKGCLDIIGNAAKEIMEDNKFPIFVGGEHLISVPVIKKVWEKYGDELIIIHFDAHADLREGYLGSENSHASAIRRLIDFMPAKNIYQFGIRSGTKDEFSFAKKNTNIFPVDVIEPLLNEIKNFKNRPVYVTLDIDVLDPAFANGTGTPEPGGISSKEMIESIIALKDLNLVGFDIVEVSPPYDLSDRTAILGAKLIREMILLKS